MARIPVKHNIYDRSEQKLAADIRYIIIVASSEEIWAMRLHESNEKTSNPATNSIRLTTNHYWLVSSMNSFCFRMGMMGNDDRHGER
jgi:hypothetical protein